MPKYIKDSHSFGKGEVVSSILPGSTRKPFDPWGYAHFAEAFMSIGYATKHEHDGSTRGKSVDFVRRAF